MHTSLPLAGKRQTARSPDEANAARDGTAELTFEFKTAMAMSFWPGSGLLFLKYSHKQDFIFCRQRSLCQHFALFLFSNAAWPET
jgi:hypothetical protein